MPPPEDQMFFLVISEETAYYYYQNHPGSPFKGYTLTKAQVRGCGVRMGFSLSLSLLNGGHIYHILFLPFSPTRATLRLSSALSPYGVPVSWTIPTKPQ